MAEHSTVHFFSNPASFREKERLYFEVRRREGRVLPDEVVRQLPCVSKSNPYAKEWRWRQRSFRRFLSCCKHLSALRGESEERTGVYNMTKKSVVGDDANFGNFRILDLGCGNGWMANRLAENPDWEVWAMDVNEEELTQGARLFGRGNLHFVYGDVLAFPPVNRWAVDENPMGFVSQPTGLPVGTFDAMFDVVVLAASVQYFPDPEALITALKRCLKPGGQIHILDSPFYQNETKRSAARQRTLEYYTKAGVPEMAAFYHHHLWADVERLGGNNLNDRLTIRILQKIKWFAPFPWIVFKS